jgi:hypothetical protein
MCCSVLLSVRGVSLYLYVSIGGGGWLPWLPLPLRQTDSYYVLYTFLLNVLKKGCWGGGEGYWDIVTYIISVLPVPPAAPRRRGRPKNVQEAAGVGSPPTYAEVAAGGGPSVAVLQRSSG